MVNEPKRRKLAPQTSAVESEASRVRVEGSDQGHEDVFDDSQDTLVLGAPSPVRLPRVLWLSFSKAKGSKSIHSYLVGHTPRIKHCSYLFFFPVLHRHLKEACMLLLLMLQRLHQQSLVWQLPPLRRHRRSLPPRPRRPLPHPPHPPPLSRALLCQSPARWLRPLHLHIWWKFAMRMALSR